MAFDLTRLDTVQLVPPTPFSADGKTVVLDRLRELVKDVVAAGIRVLLPAAGTGEFHSLSVAEAIGCVRATREAASADCVVIAPVGYGLDHAVALAKQAGDAGADALLVMPPVHPYLSDGGFRDYFQAIAAATPLPFLAYKRGPVPSDRVLGELAATGRLIGVKYAVNEMDAFTLFAEKQRGKVGLYCGTAERYAPFFMLAGATGYTSGAGNLFPKLTLALCADLKARRFDEAMKKLRTIRPIEDFRARDGDALNISAVKAGLKILGRDFGPTRPPQRRLTAEEEADLRRILEPLQAAEKSL